MTGAVAADAVTAGTPMNARTANAAPMVMSSFLIVMNAAGVPRHQGRGAAVISGPVVLDMVIPYSIGEPGKGQRAVARAARTLSGFALDDKTAGRLYPLPRTRICGALTDSPANGCVTAVH